VHDLTTGPLSRHLLKIAVPSSLGYLFSTLYNVVDNLFAGHISDAALAAIGRSFPVFFLFIITVDVGLAIGISALVSNALGAKDNEKARLYTAQGLGLGMVLATVVCVLGWVFAVPLLKLLGAEGEEIPLALAYLGPVFIAGWFIIVGYTMNGALQATGDTITVGTVSLFGFIANIGLNWVFVYPLDMGLRGIGIATLIITAITCGIFAWRLRSSGLFDFRSFRALIPQAEPMKEVLKQSLPATLSMTTVALGIVIITKFVADFGGSNAVAAYIVATRIEQLVLLPCIGMNAAVLAITGQNAGAGFYDRAVGTLKLALKAGAVLMLLGGVLVWFIARPMMALFTESEEIVDIGVDYLRITVLLFWGYMVLFLVVAYLQGLKKPMFALWIGIYRQIAMPILVFSLMLHVFDAPLRAVWWGIFAINWSGAVVTLLYAWRVSRSVSNSSQSGEATA